MYVPFDKFEGRTIEDIIKEWRDYLRNSRRGYSYDSEDDYCDEHEEYID